MSPLIFIFFNFSSNSSCTIIGILSIIRAGKLRFFAHKKRLHHSVGARVRVVNLGRAPLQLMYSLRLPTGRPPRQRCAHGPHVRLQHATPASLHAYTSAHSRVFVCCTRPHRGAVGDKGRAFKGRSETENNFMKRSLINHSDIQGQAPFFPVSSSSQGQPANSLSVMQEHGHIFLSNPIQSGPHFLLRPEQKTRCDSLCAHARLCVSLLL